MLRVTQSTVSQERTIRPVYANHQATPYGALLDPFWESFTPWDIYPGMVMSKFSGEVVTLYGAQTQVANGTSYVAPSAPAPWGLAALFVAPKLGVDEVALSGTNLMTVWRGGPQATFQILAPAFNTNASWTNTNASGARQLIAATTGAGSGGAYPTGISPGKITPFVAADYVSGYISEPIGQLITYDGPSQITVNFAPEISYFSAAQLNTASLTSI